MKFFRIFRKKEENLPLKPHKVLKRVFAGMVIGGAIGAIIGKRTIEKARESQPDEIEM
jgi:hypothetical protein